MPVGSNERDALIAAWTSRAAPLMFLSKSNCNVILVLPNELEEVISFTPAILPSDRSSGVATPIAIVSGLAPGRLASTAITGKSTCGKADTGNKLNATIPTSVIASVSKLVATGLLTNIDDIVMLNLHQHWVHLMKI